MKAIITASAQWQKLISVVTDIKKSCDFFIYNIQPFSDSSTFWDNYLYFWFRDEI